MSLLSKIAKVAGGVIGGAVGGPAGAKIGSALGGIASSAISGSKAKKAAGVQSGAYDAAAQGYTNALGQVQGIQQPYQELGTQGVNALAKVNSGDYSGFESSPDFLFAQKYGGQAVDRSAAARGNLNSGNTLIAQQQFGQGLASQQLGAYRNSLMGQIGVGQGATNAVSSATLGTADNIGNALIGGGDARASGIVAQGNALTSGIDQLSGLAGDIYGNSLIKKAKPTQAVNYNQPTYARAV